MLKLLDALININSSPLFRNTYNNALNVIRDLCCWKQTAYRVAESAFSSFFRQAYGRVCSWSSAPEF